MSELVDAVLERCTMCHSLTEYTCYACRPRTVPLCPRPECRQGHKDSAHVVVAPAPAPRRKKSR